MHSLTGAWETPFDAIYYNLRNQTHAQWCLGTTIVAVLFNHLYIRSLVPGNHHLMPCMNLNLQRSLMLEGHHMLLLLIKSTINYPLVLGNHHVMTSILHIILRRSL